MAKKDMSSSGAPKGVSLQDLQEESPKYVTPIVDDSVPTAEDAEIMRQAAEDAAAERMYNRNVTSPEALPVRKKSGGTVKAPKGRDWHGFGHGSTGKNNHGF